MAKNFCPICGTALVPGLTACPNCGRLTEPDEPDFLTEPAEEKAWAAAETDPLAPEKVQMSAAGTAEQTETAEEGPQNCTSPVFGPGPQDSAPLVSGPCSDGDTPPLPGIDAPVPPVPPIQGPGETQPYPPQSGRPTGTPPQPLYMPPRPTGMPGSGNQPAYAQHPIYYVPGPQGYGQPEPPEQISMGSYLGMSLLGMVPVLGLVFLLVWALDSPGRPNRRNFARGFLAARVIAWAVFFVLVFVLGIVIAVAAPALYY